MIERINERYKVILASNSPRRRELLAGLGLQFEVRVLADIEENYPPTLPATQIAKYIAHKKAEANRAIMAKNEMIITADTIVVVDDMVMGKPADDADAIRMLSTLSGKTHKVITGVCITTLNKQTVFDVTTGVTFKTLTDEEINYYITHFHPTDKAGAYGIQEWIGYIGVTGLEGSYYNVMGLPVQRIYDELCEF
ncbi:MAG: Maf-like protein [Prevotellaceae bacterium]|nr:Maf-like protein [Prevotellaceae bacterium]MDY6199438.1 Maf-like protein [Prevotella sp.]